MLSELGMRLYLPIYWIMDFTEMSSMGELTFFLGLPGTQKDDGIFIRQDEYMDEILKKFGFSTVKTASTPMETLKPLLKDAEAEDVDAHLFTPKVSHPHAMKRIVRYLNGKPKLGLWYPKDSLFVLEDYTDSDYAGASLDKKSITGGCQFLRNKLISWQCKKQIVVANSTTKAEDSNEKKLTQMIKININQNVADLLTKAFDVGRFQYLVTSIGMLNL
nr:hypothetical protein [Tanacetum cinerariifolium]